MKKLNTLAAVAALALLPMSQASAYVVQVYDVNTAMNSLADAYAAIAGVATTTTSATIINYDDLGDGTTGNFAGGAAFPGGANSTFAVHVTGSFYVGSAGQWTFGINHDDGARLIIDGITVVADGAFDNRNTLITNTFAVGYHSLDIVFFEQAGGASLEFFGAQGTQPWALIPSAEPVPEPASLALVGLGLAGLGFARRKKA